MSDRPSRVSPCPVCGMPTAEDGICEHFDCPAPESDSPSETPRTFQERLDAGEVNTSTHRRTSETPRTDNEEFMPKDNQCYPIVVRSSFARQLERDLAQAIKERDELLADVHQPELCDETILGLKQQLATATEALEFCLDQSWNGPLPDKARKFAAEALAAIKPEPPMSDK